MAHPNQIYVLRDVMGDKILPVYNQPPSTRHPSGLVGIRKLWQDKLNENQQLSNIPTKKRCKKIKKSGTSTRRQINKLVQMGLLKVVECEKAGETALPNTERKYYQVVPEMKNSILWGESFFKEPDIWKKSKPEKKPKPKTRGRKLRKIK